MASSSSGTITSGSGDLQRKRKRMESNRESARRSRMRKQSHVDDLTAQAARLREDRTRIATAIDETTQSFVAVDGENQILRAQMGELNQRLRSLDEIVGFVGAFGRTGCVHDSEGFVDHLNCPIMASSDVFQC